MNEDTQRLLGESSALTRHLVERVDALLTERGCSSYVKTIYIGYSLGSLMVAAVYPARAGTQIALALPEDIGDPALEDATHLTWPTMPVAVRVTSRVEVPHAMELVLAAFERVSSGQHDVVRPPEFFSDRKRGRRAIRS